jgi:fructose-bisphosphate aldolase class II
MPLVNLKTILDKADRGGYAVGAFNIVDLTFLEAILWAAQRQNSPVILNIAEVHFPFITLENVAPIAKMIVERQKVEVALNLDHGLSMDAIHQAIHLGFTSIMFDGSSLRYTENLRQTKTVVEICHSRGISVEAELGAVGGAEGGGLMGRADPALYTDVNQAGEFVRETGIDALAVAIGNAHGKYQGKPRLDFERLAAIREAAGIPLVLHGGSGIPDDDIRKAISLGIAKINFFTGMSQAALGTTRACVIQEQEAYNDYPALIHRVRGAVCEIVEEQMKIYGSAARG